ncbi:MAG: class I SAM-dependent methyltransferase [Dehalococcoidia bacterium]
MPNNSDVPPQPEPIDYVARWQQIVARRRVQMDTAYEASGLKNVDYWGRRARQYREALHSRPDEDPFFRSVAAAVTPESTLLDVGAGTGRHTLALAPHVRHITAVDPSEAMLNLLREDLEERRVGNVDVVHAEWMNAAVDPADVVLCSHVLYPIDDVASFVQRLDAYAKQRVFVYLRVDPLPTDMGLWSEFYGVPLQAQPTFVDLYPLLMQIGITADADIIEHRFTLTFASLDDAVVQARNALCLREDDGAATDKLRNLLDERLVVWPDGRLGPQIESARSAILSWAPGS